MKYLIIILMFLPTVCFAKQRIFYDKVNKYMITDLKAEKTVEELGNQYQMIEVNENEETAKILEDGTMVKHNFIEEAKTIAKEKEAKRFVKKEKMKKKLKLSEDEFQELRESLK